MSSIDTQNWMFSIYVSQRTYRRSTKHGWRCKKSCLAEFVASLDSLQLREFRGECKRRLEYGTIDVLGMYNPRRMTRLATRMVNKDAIMSTIQISVLVETEQDRQNATFRVLFCGRQVPEVAL